MNEICKMQGKLTITLRDESGKIKDRETVDNLVVTVGRQHVADQLVDKLQAAMSHMAIGTGTTAQLASDTALQTELSRNALTSKSLGVGADANKVIYLAEWSPAQGQGAITEAGIFNSVSAGVMLCRTTFPVKNKGATDSLSLTWTITVNG